MFNTMTDGQTMIAPTQQTDEQLLSAYRSGDKDAFGELFQRYERPLVGYLLSRCGNVDVSRDVCQETFLTLVDKPPRFLFGAKVKAWLFRVAGNRLVDLQRRQGRAEKKVPMTTIELDRDTGPYDTLQDSDDAMFARRLVASLPSEYSNVVRLHVFGEMKFKDIALTLGIPLGTALWRMQKALSLMRDSAREMNYER